MTREEGAVFDRLMHLRKQEALKTDWRNTLVSWSFLPDDTIKHLLEDHGTDVTLGQIASLSDAELVRSPNIGARSRNIIREYIRVLDGGPRDEVV